MPVTLTIARAAAGALTLTLDAPRFVIGRGKDCEVQLPDPTVSLRHATIRHEGGKMVVLDEGSTNGIVVGGVRLTAQTPQALREGDWLRVGRVWLELSFTAGVAATAEQAEAFAIDQVSERLAAAGEPSCACVRVVSGPDEGATLALAEPSRRYVVGRAEACDLVLADEHASRRHLALERRGARWWALDQGSKRGCELDGQPLAGAGAPWPPGVALRLGDTVLTIEDPLLEALAELRRAPDEPMRPEELREPPPGGAAPAPIEPPPPPAPVADEHQSDDDELEEEVARYGGLDVLVLLLALGMLGLSVLGLMWLLR